MHNVTGNIIVKDGKLDMKNLSMNTMEGAMVFTGLYSTSKGAKTPEAIIGLDIKNVSFNEAYESFGMIQKLAPIFENIEGKFSMKLAVNTLLDENMSPVYESMTGKGSISSKEVSVKQGSAFSQLAIVLNNDKLASFTANDINLDFAVDKGRLHTKPFDLKAGFGKMNVSGSSGIDQTLDYLAKIDLPQNTLGGKLGQLAANVKITGTFTNPKISLDTKNLAEQATAVATEKLTEAKDSVVRKVSDEVLKQAEKIKAEARKMGEDLIAEAEKQGQKLIDEANKTTNPIAKIAAVKAAEAAAKKLKDEAEKKAQQLNAEAEKQAQRALDAAGVN